MQTKLSFFDLPSEDFLERAYFQGIALPTQNKCSTKFKSFNLTNITEQFLLEEFTGTKGNQQLTQRLDTHDKTKKYPQFPTCIASKQNSHNSQGQLLINYFNGQNLFQLINTKENESLKWQVKEISNFISQLTKQCLILKKKHIVGRNIKPENIMTSIDVNNLCQPQINYHLTDLGNIQSNNEIIGRKQIRITTFYTAPEIYYKQSLNSNYNFESADVFSIGVIAYIMFFGIENFNKFFIPYYQSYTNKKIGLFLPKNSNLKENQSLANLIRNMLSFNINQRPNLKQILQTIENFYENQNEQFSNVQEIKELNQLLFKIVFPEYHNFLQIQAPLIQSTIKTLLAQYKQKSLSENEFLNKINELYPDIESPLKQYESKIQQLIKEDFYRETVEELGKYFLFLNIESNFSKNYFAAIEIFRDIPMFKLISQEIIITLETINNEFMKKFINWIKINLTLSNYNFSSLIQSTCALLMDQQKQFKEKLSNMKIKNYEKQFKNDQIFQALTGLISFYYNQLTESTKKLHQQQNLIFLKMFRQLLYLVKIFNSNNLPILINFYQFIEQQQNIKDLAILNKFIEKEAFEYLMQIQNYNYKDVQLNQSEFNQSSPIKS